VAKSAGKTLAIPTDFSEIEKSAGNYSKWKNPQEKP
jgi:hypothetical protein